MSRDNEELKQKLAAALKNRIVSQDNQVLEENNMLKDQMLSLQENLSHQRQKMLELEQNNLYLLNANRESSAQVKSKDATIQDLIIKD